jgi:hypothetical protein
VTSIFDVNPFGHLRAGEFPRRTLLGFSVNKDNLRFRAQAIAFTGDLGFSLLLGGRCDRGSS